MSAHPDLTSFTVVHGIGQFRMGRKVFELGSGVSIHIPYLAEHDLSSAKSLVVCSQRWRPEKLSLVQLIEVLRPFDELSWRALDYLSAHLTEGPTLARIASECGASSSHLSRRIKQFTGQGFSHWVRNARVERALELVSTTKMPIEQIASLVGWKDGTSHLYRTFKKVSGRRLSSFRQGGRPRAHE